MENYIKGQKVGEGTYGIVYRAKRVGKDGKVEEQEVAMKKIRMGDQKDGVSFTAIREIKVLQELKHENVISLLDVFVHKFNVYLIYEFMESDLELVIKDRNVILSPAHIKSYLRMILQGVNACHKNWVLHRDLKPSNVLLSGGVLKLADFGFARFYGSPNPRYTHTVVTRWYRAPELLFGSKCYSNAIDMWAVGCIFAEMMMRTPYFAGDNDMDQLAKIFAALGTPNEEIWPGLTSLPDYVPYVDSWLCGSLMFFFECRYNYWPPTPFQQLFTAASADAIDLLSKMLKYYPPSRISAAEALQHPYFSNAPEPTPPEELPRSVNPSAVSAKRPLEEEAPREVRRKVEDEDVSQAKKRLDFT